MNASPSVDGFLKRLLNAPRKKRDAALSAAAQVLSGDEFERLKFLVSQAEAARMISMSRFTIRRLVAAGKLHPVKVLGATRYRVSELHQLAG